MKTSLIQLKKQKEIPILERKPKSNYVMYLLGSVHTYPFIMCTIACLILRKVYALCSSMKSTNYVTNLWSNLLEYSPILREGVGGESY
jgi:choline-glycine betaine transporter